MLVAMTLIICVGAFACKKDDNEALNKANEEMSQEQNGGEEKTSETEENAKTEEEGVNELYSAIAKDLKAKEIKDDNKAFIMSLGGAYDEETLKQVLTRLKDFKEKYAYDKDFEELFLLVNIDDEVKYLMGQEFYLLIPKYDDASVTMQELELSEEGELKAVANENIDGKVVSGPTIICQNISDIAPNAEISIKDRDGETKFSPFISLKDGELMIDGAVLDASEVIKYDDGTALDYDKELFEKINDYIPKF